MNSVECRKEMEIKNRDLERWRFPRLSFDLEKIGLLEREGNLFLSVKSSLRAVLRKP